MKFNTTKSALKETLAIVGKAVVAKADSEHSYITAEYTNGKIKFSAFNGDMYIEKSITSNLAFLDTSDVSFMVKGKLLIDIVNKIADGDVELLYEKGDFVIRYCGGDAELPTMEVLFDNPLGEIEATRECLYVNGTDFAALAKKTAPFTDSGDSRPILKGINFTIANDKLVGVACDGYRISMIYVDAEAHNIDNGFNITLPAESVTALASIASDSENIRISLAGNKGIVCENNGTLVLVRALSGKYIDFARIIPTTFKHRLEVNVEAMKEAIDKALLFVADKAPVELLVTADNLTIEGNSALGTISEKMDVARKIGSGDFDICFNGKYLLEILKCLDSENVLWSLNGKMQATVFINETQTELYMLLPVRKEG